jgi:hypothetical protein
VVHLNAQAKAWAYLRGNGNDKGKNATAKTKPEAWATIVPMVKNEPFSGARVKGLDE